MQRGRPVKSEIRQNIIEILAVIGKSYGYRIHKIYNEIFPQTTRENVYYHLRKGVKLGEIAVEEVKQEQGDYSWGRIVEKTYYKTGPKAQPKGDERVKQFFKKQSRPQ